MRAEPWPDETMHARFHSGVIIPPQPLSAAVGATFDHVRADFEEWRRQEAWTVEKYRRHAGAEPSRRARFQSRSQKHRLGKRKRKRDE
jgi:hypothetical protein